MGRKKPVKDIPDRIHQLPDHQQLEVRFRERVDLENPTPLQRAAELTVLNGQLGTKRKFVAPPAIGEYSRLNLEGWERSRYELPTHTVRSASLRGQGEGSRPGWVIGPGFGLRLRIISIKDVDYLQATVHTALSKTTKDWQRMLLFLINLVRDFSKDYDIADKETGHSIFLRRTQWTILPPGELDADSIAEYLISRFIAKGKDPSLIDRERLRTWDRYGPNFCAIGENEFSGYAVYGFEQISLYVAECPLKNNATYLLDKNWEELSQLTKRELREQGSRRLIHDKTGKKWRDDVANLFNGA